jgi:hypothetical protein
MAAVVLTIGALYRLALPLLGRGARE